MELSPHKEAEIAAALKWYSLIIERNGRSWSLKFRIQLK